MKVAIPSTALTVVVPSSVPPAPDWIATVTATVELATLLPAESSIVTTGCVGSKVPDAPLVGAVVRSNSVARPYPVGVRLAELAAAIDPELKRRT